MSEVSAIKLHIALPSVVASAFFMVKLKPVNTLLLSCRITAFVASPSIVAVAFWYISNVRSVVVIKALTCAFLLNWIFAFSAFKFNSILDLSSASSVKFFELTFKYSLAKSNELKVMSSSITASRAFIIVAFLAITDFKSLV